MLVRRYTRWDGSQRVQLTPSRVFEKLAETLSFTDDLQQAMDWLLRQGLESEGERVAGLDEILEQLREQMRRRYGQVNLEHALDEIRERLRKILELERSALEQRREQPGIRQKIEFLDRLPSRPSEAIARLRPYPFEDREAGRQFQELLRSLEDLRELEEFQRRYGDLFHGPEPLGFEGALALMREFQRLKRLEEALFSGDLHAIPADEVEVLLGPATAQDLRTLQRVVQMIAESGYVTSRGGRMRLSARGARKIGELALRDIYRDLLQDRAGTHPTDRPGAAEIRFDSTRPYRWGEVSVFDLVGTLKRAVTRRVGTPIELAPEDFLVYEADAATTTSTVLLLDMSWSMSWEGRFAAAKKVALALESLLRAKFPRDYFGIVGFFTRAVELKVEDLPEASWNMGDPFTNLQDGLRLARELLARHPSRNQHIIVITDGQPTAYFSKGRLYCEWPLSFGGISLRAAAETLKEVERATRKGIVINTFMLDDSPALRAFVDRMTRINRGRALYTRPDRLGEYVLVDYLSRRRKKI